MRGGWRHTVVYDDSLNQNWRYFTHRAEVDVAHGQSKGGSGASCSYSFRAALQSGGHVRLHADTPVREHSELSLQFWARGEHMIAP